MATLQEESSGVEQNLGSCNSPLLHPLGPHPHQHPPTWSSWEYKLLEEGTSGSGPVGGSEGGGRSSKKCGCRLGTINSEDEIIERSDSEGETPRRNGRPSHEQS